MVPSDRAVRLRLGQYMEVLDIENGKLQEVIRLDPKVVRWVEANASGRWKVTKVPIPTRKGMPPQDDARMIVFEKPDDANAFRSHWR